MMDTEYLSHETTMVLIIATTEQYVEVNINNTGINKNLS